MTEFINISAKDGSQQIIFVDKICNIFKNQQGDTIISLVNDTNIVTRFSIEEILRMLKQ